MKKKLSILMALMMILSSCGCVNMTGTKNPATTETTEEPDEFVQTVMSDTRPIALMIDNDVDASRPQMGLESAYMVYEIIVEGGKTRFMALFKEHELEKVGPIRSSRHYFLDYALEHDAIYCHAGWSPKAQKDIRALGVNNINGILGDDGSVYWRDYTYDRTWHNLYSGLDKLWEKADKDKSYRLKTDNKFIEYNNGDITPDAGETAVDITLPYSDYYKVAYKYDAQEGVYKRYVDGKEHKSQTGEILTAKNIIVYQVENFNLPDTENKGRQDLKNIGTGEGYYITNGKAVKIKWEKLTREGKTRYTTADGVELKLNSGNTYIQIVPQKETITIK